MLVYEVYKRNEKKNLSCAHWGIKFTLWSSIPYLVFLIHFDQEEIRFLIKTSIKHLEPFEKYFCLKNVIDNKYFSEPVTTI